jgi:hypothetical protein
MTENVLRGIFCGGLEEISGKRVSVKRLEDDKTTENSQRFVFEIFR